MMLIIMNNTRFIVYYVVNYISYNYKEVYITCNHNINMKLLDD